MRINTVMLSLVAVTALAVNAAIFHETPRASTAAGKKLVTTEGYRYDSAAKSFSLRAVTEKQEMPGPITSVLEVKLAEDSGIRLRSGKLVITNDTKSSAALDSLLSVLEANGVRNLERLFKSADEAQLDRDQSALSAKSGRKLKNLNTWLRVELANNDADAVATELKKLGAIENAYAEPAYGVDTTDDLTVWQGFKRPAAAGSDIEYAVSSNIPGVKGENVKIADIEYGWNHDHEDLSKLRLSSGSAIRPECESTDDNHGTAVAGLLVADDNGFGVTGIVPNATFRSIAFCTSPVDGLISAHNNLSAGDVVVIPLYTQTEFGDRVPIEYNQSNYDAINVLTASGIIVVETASNYNLNLDDPKYGGAFTTRPNSGAIIVGAGVPSDESRNLPVYPCWVSEPERSRMSWSNYGSRVDVQNWGTCVATTGYGDYDNFTAPKNSSYTRNFDGTSASAPIVAGLAASISSVIEAKFGRTATPLEVKRLLVENGTPQDTTSPGAPSGNIGNLPDMKAILQKITSDYTGGGPAPTTDTVAPTAPQHPQVSYTSDYKAALRWDAAIDNVGVTEYVVYRDGVKIAETTGLSYVDSTTFPGYATVYYTLKAKDAAGNVSIASRQVSFLAPYSPTPTPTTDFFDDFSTNDFSKWTKQVNMSTIIANDNSKALAFSDPAAKRVAYATKDLPSGVATLYTKASVRVNASGSHNLRVLAHRALDGPQIVAVARTSAGKLAVVNDVTGVTTTSATAFNLNTNYGIQLRTTINGAGSITEVWLNGTKINDLTLTHNLGTANVGRIQIGETISGRSFEVRFDDVRASESRITN